MKRYLDYTLDTGIDGQLKFQIQYQSKEVDKFFDFLKKIGKDSYLTKVGYKIARSVFPEFKISTNTIYLRGALKSLDNKVDVTRFVNNKTYRAGSIKMLNDALKEFINEVRRADNNGLLDDSGISIGANRSYSNSYSMPKTNPLAKLNILGIPVMPTPAVSVPSTTDSWVCFKTSAKPTYTPKSEVVYIYL